MRERAGLLAGAAAMLVALVGCVEGEKHERGWDYLPDMYDSPAYRSYQSERVIVRENGKDVEHHVPMLLTPVDGTVPRDFVPYAIAPADFASARKNPNPLTPTEKVLREGQAAFNTFCVVCHGNDGDAKNGYVAKYFNGVMSVNSPNVAGMPDGEVYHIVTLGRGRMPNYRAQLPPETRWAVVLYVKSLARANVAAELADNDLKAKQAEADKPGAKQEAKDALERAKATAAAAKRDRDLIIRGQAGADAYTPKPAAVPEYIKPEWPEH